MKVNTDHFDEHVAQQLDRDARAGYTPVEALERCGLLRISNEQADSPWEIDEFADLPY
jgi:hypothetical protein